MSTTNETNVIVETTLMPGRNQKRSAWTTNMTTKVARLVIRSDAHAQKTRPAALPMLTKPTIPAATTVVAPVNSWKSGASWEMMEIPAQVFRKSSSQSAYHC